MDTNTEKSWLEVEMDESVTLLRQKLEILNKEDAEDLCSEDLHDMKNIYKTLFYIFSIKKSMGK